MDQAGGGKMAVEGRAEQPGQVAGVCQLGRTTSGGEVGQGGAQSARELAVRRPPGQSLRAGPGPDASSGSIRPPTPRASPSTVQRKEACRAVHSGNQGADASAGHSARPMRGHLARAGSIGRARDRGRRAVQDPHAAIPMTARSPLVTGPRTRWLARRASSKRAGRGPPELRSRLSRGKALTVKVLGTCRVANSCPLDSVSPQRTRPSSGLVHTPIPGSGSSRNIPTESPACVGPSEVRILIHPFSPGRGAPKGRMRGRSVIDLGLRAGPA